MEPNEEDVVEDDDDDDEADSNADGDELLLAPKSPIPEEICSSDEDGNSDGVEEDGIDGMEKVFAKVMAVEEEPQEEEEEEEDTQPPALPPTLPPLIVTDDAGIPSSPPVIRPVPGITMTSLVYAPRPYSAPKKISPP